MHRQDECIKENVYKHNGVLFSHEEESKYAHFQEDRWK